MDAIPRLVKSDGGNGDGGNVTRSSISNGASLRATDSATQSPDNHNKKTGFPDSRPGLRNSDGSNGELARGVDATPSPKVPISAKELFAASPSPVPRLDFTGIYKR
jgi:hypothetical protein